MPTFERLTIDNKTGLAMVSNQRKYLIIWGPNFATIWLLPEYQKCHMWTRENGYETKVYLHPQVILDESLNILETFRKTIKV